MERRVDRALPDLEGVARHLLDVTADPPPMHWLERQSLQDQHIKRSLNDISRFWQFSVAPVEAKGEYRVLPLLRKGIPAPTLAPRYLALASAGRFAATPDSALLNPALREPILMLSRTLRWFILAMVSALPAAAQTFELGSMEPKRTLSMGVLYANDSWDEYWEGTLKRSNGNIGTLTTQSVTMM